MRTTTDKKTIIVLGMHRSGTSALSGTLCLLGIFPGSNLIPAVAGVNPKGFWEHAEIVSIHNQLLTALGSSWSDETPLPEQWWTTPLINPFRDQIINVLRRDFSDSPIWLMKDPRMCRLLPLWLDMLHELNCQPLFILTVRHPAEVARSLRKRDDYAEAVSCLLWLTHMLDAEYLTRGHLRTFVVYDRLLADWRQTAKTIERTLSLPWPIPIEQAAPGIDAFLDPALRNHSGDIRLPPHQACNLAQEVYMAMSSAEPAPDELDRLRQRTLDLVNVVAPWSKQMQKIEGENIKLRIVANQAELLRAEVERIKSTLSWHVTKPFRFAWNMLRRLPKP